MSVEKGFKAGMPYIYKKAPEDLIMFGFVRGITCNFSGASEADGVRAFMSAFNISEDEFLFSTAYYIYAKMKREFPDVCACKNRKQAPVYTGLRGMIQKEAENWIMFGYVEGMARSFPSMQNDVLKMLKMWLQMMGLPQDELFDRHEAFKSMRQQYSKLFK
jgi:hypothetical protein